jgi:hypothetical protein
MSEPKYKVGDKFKFGSGGDREIIAAHVDAEGAVRYFVDFNNGDTCDLLTEEYIELRYKKIEPFFEVGKTYAWKNAAEEGGKYSTWYIEQVRELHGSKYAVAVFTPNFKVAQEMAILRRYSFADMTEV